MKWRWLTYSLSCGFCLAMLGCTLTDYGSEPTYRVQVELPQPAPPAAPLVNPEKMQQLQQLYTKLTHAMQLRFLLEDDLRDGKKRFNAARECLRSINYNHCLQLLQALDADMAALRIDATFINEKNARLLALIQEARPSPAVQEQIDQASEVINQLLVQQDYIAINQHMTGIFQLLY